MKRTFLAALALFSAVTPGCSQSEAGTHRQDHEHSAKAPALPLAGWVTDAAHVFTAAENNRISARLRNVERQTGSQMVVVTVTTLEQKDIKTFTSDLGNAWGIGRKGYDDGVVLLLAPNQRQARIATGSGLKAKLPDGVCQQIMDQQMIPHFRKGDMAGGIEAGIDALAAKLGAGSVPH